MAKEESGGTAGGQEGAGGDGKKDPNADLYEDRGPKKIIRLITVMAYMFSVSFMGIVLSAYYLFLWEPPNPRLIQRNLQLSAEPQAEFLIGEPIILTSNNNSMEHPERFFSRSFFRQVASEARNSSGFPKAIIGRIANDESDEKESVASLKRAKLNESLSLLRNTLIDILRRNATHADRVTDVPPVEDEESNSTSKFTEPKIMGGILRDNDTSLTLGSSLKTIFGGEVKKDLPAAGGNKHTRVSFGSFNQLDYNSTKAKYVGEETIHEYPPVMDGGENRKDKDGRVLLEKPLVSSPDDESIMTVTTKKLLMKENLSEDKIEEVRKKVDFDSSHNTEKTGLSGHPPGFTISSLKLLNIATNNKDTQIEKVTKPPVVETEHFAELEAPTTQQPKDLMTMLTNIAVSERILSVTPLSTTTEASQTEFSLTTENNQKNSTVNKT